MSLVTDIMADNDSLIISKSNDFHSSVSDVNNLINISWKSEDEVIRCLENRILDGKYYTWAGIALIAINPCKEIHHLYSEDVKKLYTNIIKSGVEEELLPHAYAVAARARYKLLHDIGTTNQVIIISGDSGSGKTYTAWHLLNFLASNGNHSDSTMAKKANTLWQICCSVPVLSAFGNAQTKCNENSSRFGKLLQLQYRDGCIVGAYIQTYLLEKTRVASQPRSERNFHIFHQLLAGLSIDYLNQLYLNPEGKYNIISGSNTQADQNGYRETLSSLIGLGMTSHTCHQIFQVLACIIHLGNISFIKSQYVETYVLDLQNEASLISWKAACALIGLTGNQLQAILTSTLIVARSHSQRRSTVYEKPSTTAEECCRRRDCLMRFLYERLFKWVVSHVNTRVSEDNKCTVLGILDIYGFEIFDNNSLEQLCINYANERLQYHFINDFMTQQQDMMRDEGCDIQIVCHEESHDRVQLLDAPVSVFSTLDEECVLQRISNDTNICQKLSSNLNASKYLSVQSCEGTSEFTIKHYAGDVSYNTHRMLEKNSDKVPQELVNVLGLSNNSFIIKLLEVEEVDQKLSIRRNTLVTKFKSSVDSLCKILQKADTQYIRCMKANPRFLPEVVDSSYFKKQLNASGILEIIPLCQKYFPIRLKYDEFEERYGSLVRNSTTITQSCDGRNSNDSMGGSPVNSRRASLVINEVFGPDLLESQATFGLHTMFLTEAALLQLEEWRLERRLEASELLQDWKDQQQTNAATKIQRCARSWILRKQKSLEVLCNTSSFANSKPIETTYHEHLHKNDRCKGDASETVLPLMSSFSDSPSPQGSGDRAQRTINGNQTNSTILVSKKLLHSVYFGDGIVSKRQIIKIPVRFHLKTTCLANSYILPFCILPRGLEDAV